MNTLRVAWIGSIGDGGGVGGFGRDLLEEFIKRDVALTLFTLNDPEPQRELLGDARSVEFEHEAARWNWNRWYSRNHGSIYLSSLLARQAAHRRLIRRLVARHRETPFDAVVQFSQTEVLSMRKHLDELPPVIIFPCVHAAGELRWHRAESRLARQSESTFKHYAVRATLIYRTWIQRRDSKLVAGEVGMSRRFNELVRQDYGIAADRQSVVYQPISPRHLAATNNLRHEQRAGGKVELIFVGRIAIRKGIDLLVNLSHRLDDLADVCRISLVGGASFFSDYTAHLKRLNPRVAQYLGTRPHQEILKLFANSDIILVPSKYEPGGIVLPEAVATGCVAVVSDEVGGAEPLPESICVRFRSLDIGDFELKVRAMIAKVREQPHQLRNEARACAHQFCTPESSADDLETAIRSIIQSRPIVHERGDVH